MFLGQAHSCLCSGVQHVHNRVFSTSIVALSASRSSVSNRFLRRGSCIRYCSFIFLPTKKGLNSWRSAHCTGVACLAEVLGRDTFFGQTCLISFGAQHIIFVLGASTALVWHFSQTTIVCALSVQHIVFVLGVLQHMLGATRSYMFRRHKSARALGCSATHFCVGFLAGSSWRQCNLISVGELLYVAKWCVQHVLFSRGVCLVSLDAT